VVPGFFQAGVDAIGRIWGRLVDIVSGPINTMKGWINNDLIGPLNKVTGLFGLTIPTLGGGGPVGVDLMAAAHGRAEGGLIVGPGTGTSDSILGVDARGIPTARVSDGEYVVNADATAKNRGLLEQINTGKLPGFFLGGLIDGAMSQVEDWLATGAKFAADHILGPAEGLIGQMVPSPEFANKSATGSVHQLHDLIGAWAKKKDEDGGGLPGIKAWINAQSGKPYIWGGAGPGGYDCCLVGASIVATTTGPVPIRELRPGQRVLSYVDGDVLDHAVLAAWQSKHQPVFEVRTHDRAVTGSANHPFLRVADTSTTPMKVEWTRLDALRPGDQLVQLDDDGFAPARILAITPQCEQDTYDLTVEGAHNFIADGVVVHNSGFTGAVYGKMTGRGGGDGQRYFTTLSDFHSLGFSDGPGGVYTIGVSPSHMVGRYGGLPFEAGHTPIVAGSGAQNTANFPRQYHMGGDGPGQGVGAGSGGLWLGDSGTPAGGAKGYAQSILNARGQGDQFGALDFIFTKESGWDPWAVNPSSGAKGIPQALGHGNVFALGDWKAQVDWGIDYMDQRYGSPNAAAAYWRSHNYYDQGGILPPGTSLATNNTGQNEHVLTPSQMAGRGSSGDTFNLNFTGPIYADRAGIKNIARQVADEIANAQRQNGRPITTASVF